MLDGTAENQLNGGLAHQNCPGCTSIMAHSDRLVLEWRKEPLEELWLSDVPCGCSVTSCFGKLIFWHLSCVESLSVLWMSRPDWPSLCYCSTSSHNVCIIGLNPVLPLPFSFPTLQRPIIPEKVPCDRAGKLDLNDHRWRTGRSKPLKSRTFPSSDCLLPDLWFNKWFTMRVSVPQTSSGSRNSFSGWTLSLWQETASGSRLTAAIDLWRVVTVPHG